MKPGPLLFLLLAPSTALAFPSNLVEIPNTPASCGTCHVSSSGGGPRNPFGQDVERNFAFGMVDWVSVAPLDSDGDGFTNGEELGDPDGSWQRGDPSPAPRAGERISLPGRRTSTPISDDDGEDPSESGGCAGLPVAGWAPLWLVLGLVRWRGPQSQRGTRRA